MRRWDGSRTLVGNAEGWCPADGLRRGGKRSWRGHDTPETGRAGALSRKLAIPLTRPSARRGGEAEAAMRGAQRCWVRNLTRV